MLFKDLGIKVFAASFLAFVAVTSYAAVEESHFDLGSTQDLLILCGATSEDPDFVAATYMCRGFLKGTHQYHDAVAAAEDKKPLACPPDGTTLADARAVFIAWGEKNGGDSKLMGEAPVIGYVRSIVERFPCE
jgi:hypothetical protein